MSSLIRRASSAAACLAFISAPLMAQTNDVVPQKDVTPKTLIDALTPAAKPTPEPVAASASASADSSAPAEAAAAASGEASFRTRGFKLAKPYASPSKGPAKKAASASLMITFETDSTRLTPESKVQLANLGTALASEKLAAYKFNIEGHADSRGSADHNLKLSEERAQIVRQYLISNHQIDGSRLNALGKGDAEQLNPGNPAAPENRRVRVVTITE